MSPMEQMPPSHNRWRSYVDLPAVEAPTYKFLQGCPHPRPSDMTYVGRGLHRSWSSPCLYEKGRRAEDNLVGDLGENEVHVAQRDPTRSLALTAFTCAYKSSMHCRLWGNDPVSHSRSAQGRPGCYPRRNAG